MLYVNNQIPTIMIKIGIATNSDLSNENLSIMHHQFQIIPSENSNNRRGQEINIVANTERSRVAEALEGLYSPQVA